MKPSPSAARHAVVVAACITTAALMTACGSSPSPSARPTVTVTVTAPATTAPTASAQASATPTPAGPRGCLTTALTISLGAGSGAAGSIYYPIKFTNSSSSTCSLYGYPGVSFVTTSGGQAGAAAVEDPIYPRQRVTLAPGDTAHADVRVTDARNYPSSRCDPVSVHRLKVFPPGQTSALDITLAATACSSASVQILAVQTVRPGSSP